MHVDYIDMFTNAYKIYMPKSTMEQNCCMGDKAIGNDFGDAHNVVRGLQVNQLGTSWQIALCPQRSLSKGIRDSDAL